MIIDPGLLNHINHRMNDGEDVETIRQSLLASGWPTDQVDAACTEVAHSHNQHTLEDKHNPSIFMPNRRLYEDRSAIDGRLSAYQYLLGLLGLVCFDIISAYALFRGYTALPETLEINTIFFTLGLGLCLVNIFALISLCTRRLHDLERSNTWILLLLMPGVNALFLLTLCLPGHAGANRYGEDPRSFNAFRILLNRP